MRQTRDLEKYSGRVLHIVGQLRMGGVEKMLMNLLDYREIKNFDFLSCSKPPEYFDNLIDSYGCRAYHPVIRRENFIGHYKAVHDIAKHYDVVHIHTQNAFFTTLDCLAVRQAGVKRIIVHCHNTSDWRNKKLRTLHEKFRGIAYSLSDIHLACGQEAGKYMYADRKFEVVPLPIDCDKYRIDRDSSRLKDGAKSLIHIGRFDDVKNQAFLIEIFKEYTKLVPDAKLTMIGTGDTWQQIKDTVDKLGLTIEMPGNVNDVPERMKDADALVFPQKYEGFPTVILEAQAAGLKCFISDTITKDIKQTDEVQFIQLKCKPEIWAREIYDVTRHSIKDHRQLADNESIAYNYDIKLVNSILDNYWSLE